MKNTEQKLLKARLEAANREHQADANDNRVEHHPLRNDIEGHHVAAGIEHEHEPEGSDPRS